MKPLITLSFTWFLMLPAYAQIFVKQNANGNHDGSSWQDAFTDVQAALDASVPGDEIWIAAGTYIPTGATPETSHFLADHPVALYGGFTGEESSLEQRNWEANLTIISGDKNGDDTPGMYTLNRTDNAHHTFIINAGMGTTVVDGLVFQGGATRPSSVPYAPDANDIPYNRWSGGALYIYKSSAVIRNCLIQDNDGTRGSGLYAFAEGDSSLTLTIDNVKFINNGGYNGCGGFVQAWYNLKVTKTLFDNNHGFQGGAFFLSGSYGDIEDCTFTGNTATYGGGLLSFNGNTSLIVYPTLDIRNTTFSANAASALGGAIYINSRYDGFSFTVDSCLFAGNSASPGSGFGGAIAAWEYADTHTSEKKSLIQVTNSTFEGNASLYGGALELEPGDDSMDIVIANSVFNNNATMPGQGGAISISGYDFATVDLTIQENVFNGNQGSIGGAITLEAIGMVVPIKYAVDQCTFEFNTATVGGGGLVVRSYPETGMLRGEVRHSQFRANQGIGLGGAIFSLANTMTIHDCSLYENYSEGSYSDSTYEGGGAILVEGPGEIEVHHSIFRANNSLRGGGALVTKGMVAASIENVLLTGHNGESTVQNAGTMRLVNVTMADNEYGLRVLDSSSIEIQNSIFSNIGINIKIEGEPAIVSRGGNISHDNSLEGILNGSGIYADQHSIDPKVDSDYVPVGGSPAIDAGNPTGIKTPTDLAGNPRIIGSNIDAGSFESFLTSSRENSNQHVQLQLLPNPVVDDLLIVFGGEIEAVQIVALDGKQMNSTGILDGAKRINVADLLPGNYILKLKSGGRWYVSQFSKA